jgi:hypothetical protein
MNDVHYAQAIDARPIVSYLQSTRYDREAIVECFQSLVLCGLLRPINGTKVILDEENNEGKIFEGYILDQFALATYIDLILFKKWSPSLTFFNMALRARYRIRGDHHLDNMTYEAYTLLVFLFDLLEREQALEAQLAGTGVMFRPLSARIRNTIFAKLPGEISPPRSRSVSAQVKKEQAELVLRTKEMLQDARWKLSKQAGII